MIYRVLLVDDEPYIVESISHILIREFGESIETYTASTAIKALELLSQNRIDIVMTDINMPRMSGVELYNEILKRWKKCKVVFLTGYDDFNYIQKAMRGGAIDYLLKTESTERIIEAIKQAIDTIDEEMNVDNMINEYNKTLDLAIPVFQKEFFQKLLDGHKFEPLEMKKQMEICQMCSQHGLLMLLKIDFLKDKIINDRNAFNEINEIIKKYLSDDFYHLLIEKEKSERVCVLWSRKNGMYLEEKYVVLTQIIEQIQYSCQKQGISLSVLIDSEFVALNELSNSYINLKRFLSMEVNFGHEQAVMRYNENMLTFDSTKKYISRINDYICSNLHGDLSLTKLASVVHFSPSYLSRFYKNETGIGLSEFILKERIEKAILLLPKTGYKIQEIAAIVGFERTSYFAKVFKERVGCTPQDYRQNLAEQQNKKRE